MDKGYCFCLVGEGGALQKSGKETWVDKRGVHTVLQKLFREVFIS